MNDDQIKKLVEAIKQQRTSKASDYILQIGVALCIAGILWVGSQIVNLDKSLAVVQQQQLDLKANISRLNEFTKKPRFTQDDFNTEIKSVLQEIRHNQDSINDLRKEILLLRNKKIGGKANK